jgi:hypothetical protein
MPIKIVLPLTMASTIISINLYYLQVHNPKIEALVIKIKEPIKAINLIIMVEI